MHFSLKRFWPLAMPERNPRGVTEFESPSEVCMRNPSRREFLKSTVTTVCSAGLNVCGFAGFLTASVAPRGKLALPATLPIKKGVLLDMLPTARTYVDRMKMARDVGFEVVQA